MNREYVRGDIVQTRFGRGRIVHVSKRLSQVGDQYLLIQIPPDPRFYDVWSSDLDDDDDDEEEEPKKSPIKGVNHVN